jgi:hypothetical protein
MNHVPGGEPALTPSYTPNAVLTTRQLSDLAALQARAINRLNARNHELYRLVVDLAQRVESLERELDGV